MLSCEGAENSSARATTAAIAVISSHQRISLQIRMPSDTQVSKWGNGLAGRIPVALAREARLAEGDRLTLDLATDGSIVLRPARRKYELRQLVLRITTKNRQSETDWGPPAGQESWGRPPTARHVPAPAMSSG